MRFKRFLKRFFGTSYYQYIKSPNPHNHLCIVEKVDVNRYGKTFTPICFCSEAMAKAKVELWNKLFGDEDVKD
ncbi:putative AdoMet-MTase [Citrobacter phage CVT22]|uniref:AdoMet-MTase n=1 Tax=Citrobacter phage CVT22 TaxID=1622234 RepID=A0A0R6CRE5_9CAUD|nr:putative AdoMet-MTase [Citrobacter phage CVT22]AJT60731.1 putative AdoMet-MTase [Citrobacter phage CVT22]